MKPVLSEHVTHFVVPTRSCVEEAIQALDLLLAELQNDSVPLADLQQKVLHGEVYLNRCQSLLDSVEQSIVELDPTTLKATTDA